MAKIIKKFDGGYKFNPFLCEDETNIIIHHALRVNGNIIEVGCNRGLTSLAISKVCPTKIIYAIDCETPTNKDQQYEVVALWAECKGINNIVCINANSQTMDLNLFKDIGMVFIDGDHTYEGVKKDYENSRKLIKEGVIIFHDYKPDTNYIWNEVAKFVDELSIVEDIIIYSDTMLAMMEITK